MKNMKKILAILLALCMVFSMAACSSSSDTAEETEAAEEEAEEEEAEEAEEAEETEEVEEAEEEAEEANSEFVFTTEETTLEQSYSFNVGSSSTDGTTITKTFNQVQDVAPEMSGGQLEMTYYGASSLGSDSAMLTECVAGNIPIVVMTTASVTETVPELGLFDMHCAMSSMDTLSALMEDSEFLEEMQSWFEAKGLHLIGWESQSSKLLSTTKRINSIEDFEGYSMRTLSNTYHIAFWNAVGANTIQIDASELYLSMQQSLVEGVEMNMASILSRQLPEVAPYVQETMTLPHMSLVVMNLDCYNSMTESDQAWFDSFMSDVNVLFNETAVVDNEEGIKEVEDGGGTYVEFNQELFDDLKEVAETSSWEAVREDLGDELVDWYIAKIDAIES